MAYSEELAERVRAEIGGRDGVTEKQMFGGIAWLVGGNMAVGTLGENLMVRVAKDEYDRILTEPHAGPMNFTGRTMRGFVEIDAAGIADDAGLARWIDEGANYAASLPAK